MEEKDKNIRREITKLLVELGIPMNLQGFQFLRESIISVVYDPSLMKSVTKCLYPYIGEIYKVKSTVVERAMRHAADVGFNKTNFQPIKKIYKIEDYNWNYKFTNSELIAMIAEYIRIDIEEVI